MTTVTDVQIERDAPIPTWFGIGGGADRLALSDADWDSGTWASTVINSNSPRRLDIPMAQGIIDFARAGQMTIVTPFCLAGAMAPVTVAGALVLQHAEALAEALEPFVTGYSHTSVFLSSREKMHSAGRDLYREEVESARAALAAYRSVK